MTDYIKREDAVKAVIRMCAPICDNTDSVVVEINALPSAEAEPKVFTEDDYWKAQSADAEQVASKLKNPCDSLLKDDSAECKEQKSKLDLISRADAVKVVRCKDCRHAEHRKQMPNQVYCHRDLLSTSCAVHDDDDFCKYGERRRT